ncbi:MAG TPA: hypothetical protein VL984_13055 [Acidimicrobiales bacterium]|nr:hypothetical protein [Acidimicrobiales bacterium]
MAAAVVLLANMVWALPSAQAAFPTYSGDIAFYSATTGGIEQVNPEASNPSSTITQLTNQFGDVEPFYSPDGSTVYFSSSRCNNASGNFSIYSVPQSSSSPVTELSESSCQGTDNDYAPSDGPSPDGNVVIFNRDNDSIDTLWAPTGSSSVCALNAASDPLYGGYALASGAGSDGFVNRTVFDPANPSNLVYVDSQDHLILVSGITFPSGTNPCGETALTYTDLSAAAFNGTNYGSSSGEDFNPDWSSNGNYIVFNSDRSYSSSTGPTTGPQTLFIMDLNWDAGTPVPTAAPIWNNMAMPTGTTNTTQPVFSPDTTAIAFVYPKSGTQVETEAVSYDSSTGTWDTFPSSTVLTQTSPGSGGVYSEPDWQPLSSNTALPESKYPVALAGGALLVLGLWFGSRHLPRRPRRQKGPVAPLFGG